MKKASILFVVACMALCLLPLVGMVLRPTTESTENTDLATFPGVLTEDGTPNLKFFDEFEEYFNDHFAFRNELVYADACIQSKVFRTSSVDNVIAGESGWLFYTSTRKDYLGTDRLSEREIFSIAHNLAVAEEYVRSRGADFVLAIPPNKNTLYGENMPYYDSLIVDGVHDLDRLQQVLSEKGVTTADLVSMFRNEEEVLYLKRDSHWNNRGALMAYNCIMDSLGRPHDSYADASARRTKSEDGDLNRMLYTFYGEKEVNTYYDIPFTFTYKGDFGSVEDLQIETGNPGRDGSLLMFRDSFGNTLLPFIAEQFGQAFFTKEGTYRLEKWMDEYAPDAVILEKVERNLSNFLDSPPVITSPEREKPENAKDCRGTSGPEMKTYMFDAAYYEISGTIEESYISERSDIVISVGDKSYCAYYTGETDYTVYLKKEDITEFPLTLSTYVLDGDAALLVQEQTIEEGDIAL